MKDWSKIERIFEHALELEGQARKDYLAEACGPDDTLRHEVESLLTHHEELSPTFLDQPLAISTGLAPPAPPEAGDTVGAYRIVEKLGQGGMGTVYLGERSDGAFDRQVAVKVLRRGMEDETARLRFEMERHILAGLDHPGIARLLDGGTTAAGSPFVVMELVDGEPIDRYCDAHGSSVNERIDLVLEVCEAVASAHQNLVVHRDLKPSNVLVGADGRPKLLDFGIAKILDRERLGPGLETTASWQRLLTPSWASPEQVRGDRITVATDVYLLGILLYKLLTGRVPHRFTSSSLVEAEIKLTTEVPKAPGRVLRELGGGEPDDPETRPPVGVGAIDQDLDFIVLKALRSEAAERYGSVAELVDDLRRFRAGHPITARAGNRRYLARKFVQRHWRALAMGATVVVLLAVFAIDRSIQVRERDQALARAQASLESREALWSFVGDLFWSADPQEAKGRELTVLEAIDRGQAKLDRGQVSSREMEALVLALFGRIYYGQGKFVQARETLERSIEVFESLDLTDPKIRLHKLRARGTLALAWLYALDADEDDLPKEEVDAQLAALLDQASIAHDQSRFLESSDPTLALELSNPLAEIYCLIEKFELAKPLTEEAVALLERDPEARTLAVAQALGRRALILKNLENDLEGARELYTRALDIHLELEGPIHPDVANLQNQLGLLADQLGDPETAITLHQQALAARRELFPEGHVHVGQSLAHLASIYRDRGELDAALDAYRQAAQNAEAGTGPTGVWTVRYHLALAQTLIDAGRPAEAEAILRVQLDPEHRAARPDDSLLPTQAEGYLGAALLAQGQGQGQAMVRASLESLRKGSARYQSAVRWLEAFLSKKNSGG